MNSHHYVACDLGAESGRIILGHLSDGNLTIEEIHRFTTGPSSVFGTLRWNIWCIDQELKVGLRRVASSGLPVTGLSSDSWGVDYVHLFRGEPLTAPYHYRDSRTDGLMERVFSEVSRERIYSETGIQFMPSNTLYQLYADKLYRPEVLWLSEKILNFADYFNYVYSGIPRAEESIASTTQLYNPLLHDWSKSLIENLRLPERVFPTLISSGTTLGPLVTNIVKETGLSNTQVIATCSHDTAAAVAAIPAKGEDWAYVSSGTWSLLGIECPEPIITPKSLKYNFANEMGYGRKTRFLKNISGLWLVQECRRKWIEEGSNFTYAELTKSAARCKPLRSLINPCDPRFFKRGKVPAQIVSYCRETRQASPNTPGEFVRCILESLAMLYRLTLEELQEVTGRKPNRLYIVGGGSKNELLNQFTANVTQINVYAGPAEATAIANLLVQAVAMGDVNSIAEVRDIVGRSFLVKRFEAENDSGWQEAFLRFQELSN